MNRRDAVTALGGLAIGLCTSPGAALVAENRTTLGLVIFCRQLLRHQQQARGAGDLFDPFTFLEHCRSLGAGGMQVGLGVMSPERCEALRGQAADGQMFVEAIVRLPQDAGDVSRFEEEIQTAARIDVAAARTTIIPGRRYENFDSLEMFREFERRGRESLERAVPIAEKHRVVLAVENHKDHRIAERVALFEHIDSEFVGACVDTGNSFALLEDPLETVTALAPWAHSVHLKDQAVQPTEDGFLLGDIPLGQGFLELEKMIAVLQQHQPEIHFCLELITRDPLRVPCLSETYWATFPDLPARDLARTLRQVHAHASAELPVVSRLPLADQVALETDHVRSSLRYAGRTLGLRPEQ